MRGRSNHKATREHEQLLVKSCLTLPALPEFLLLFEFLAKLRDICVVVRTSAPGVLELIAELRDVIPELAPFLNGEPKLFLQSSLSLEDLLHSGGHGREACKLGTSREKEKCGVRHKTS